MKGLPTGLEGAYRALTDRGDDRDVFEQITTLIWLRVLTDPAAPLIGGHDPRSILTEPITWDEVATLHPDVLTMFCNRLNEVLLEGLLYASWDALPDEMVTRAAREVGRWKIPNGDPLGAASQFITSQSSKSAKGAFYTPYEVSLMMAMMTDPFPGASVCDPCCGSGSMLLAALEAVRTKHGADAILECFGTDIDAQAVRLCKLNLTLAGIAPNAPGKRVYEADALLDAPPAMREARREYEEQARLFD